MPTNNNTLRILFVAAEADPLVKVGGLGDVTGSLPRALRALAPAQAHGRRLDARLVIPFHAPIAKNAAARGLEIKPLLSFEVPTPGGSTTAQAYQTQVGELPVYLIAGGPIGPESPVYSPDIRQDAERYTFFSLAVFELMRALRWPPHILHANDWHTALTAHLLVSRHQDDPFFAGTRTVLSIHNLPFMGAGADPALAAYGISQARDQRLPAWGSYQPLPMGLSAADAIITVSPSYVCEIMTPGFGSGLHNFMQMRAGSLHGILNGLDQSAWDPSSDPALVANFDRTTLERRAANKQALLAEVGLPAGDPTTPLLIMIGRLDHQKGVDLALAALREMIDLPWQAILLGVGDPTIEEAVRQMEASQPERVRAILRFDDRLARRMYASGDLILMPSRYEPCGLAQMIAMRYGCLPVARATGGLCDTINDDCQAQENTGFLFDEATPEALAEALRRAFTALEDSENWQARQQAGMRQDFSWQRSAQAYARIYHELSL